MKNARIPVIPFALNDYSKMNRQNLSFVYTLEGIKYWYSFAATKEKDIRNLCTMHQKDRKH